MPAPLTQAQVASRQRRLREVRDQLDDTPVDPTTGDAGSVPCRDCGCLRAAYGAGFYAGYYDTLGPCYNCLGMEAGELARELGCECKAEGCDRCDPEFLREYDPDHPDPSAEMAEAEARADTLEDR